MNLTLILQCIRGLLGVSFFSKRAERINVNCEFPCTKSPAQCFTLKRVHKVTCFLLQEVEVTVCFVGLWNILNWLQIKIWQGS